METPLFIVYLQSKVIVGNEVVVRLRSRGDSNGLAGTRKFWARIRWCTLLFWARIRWCTLFLWTSCVRTLNMIFQLIQVLWASISADNELDLLLISRIKLLDGTPYFCSFIVDHLGKPINITSCRYAIAVPVVSYLIIVPLGFHPVFISLQVNGLPRCDILALWWACIVKTSNKL